MSYEHPDFTEFEIAEYKEAFRLWDSNNDGELNPKELTNLFKSIGHNFSESEVLKLMKDTGHPDKVDFNGFLQILSKFMEKKKVLSYKKTLKFNIIFFLNELLICFLLKKLRSLFFCVGCLRR